MPGDEPVPLIYNPTAGGGRGRRDAESVARRFQAAGVRVTLEHTSGPGGAMPLAEALAKDGHARVFVIGGDGTHSEAAEGVIRAGADTVLGLLPGGTGNDTLRDFDLRDVERAVHACVHGTPRALDAMHVTWDDGDHYDVNVFGTGFMAKVCATANRHLKWLGGKSYTAAVFPEVARLASPLTRVELDGETMEGRFVLAAVCNTQYAGTGMWFAPMAEPDDGLLEVILLERVSRTRLVRIFPTLFKGTHLALPEVQHHRVKHVRIAPETPSPLLGDGEVYGRTPVDVRVVPRAWRLLVA